MKVLYMGTGAYDSIPAPFCTCKTCKKAFALGGKEVRTRTQTLINDDLLIDFNADSISHFIKYKIDTTKIKTCLITHSHSDHLYPEDIIIPQYSMSSSSVEFYSAKDGYDKIVNEIEKSDDPEKVYKCINIKQVKVEDTFESNGYKILVLPANHDPNSSPVLYAIEKSGKRMLYALDTGVFFDKTFELLKDFGKFDLVVFDCTGGLNTTSDYYNGHMNFKRNLEMIETMKDIKLIDESTKKVITHFSHNGNSLHSDLKKEASKYGIIVAYDGLEMDF